jgi:16S rRNA (uracil1498-N3)-methyltransferase
MYRFRVSAKNGEYFEVADKELRHLLTVLRLGPGDRITGFDNSGKQWIGSIESITRDSALCRIVEEQFPEIEARTRVYLVMGLAKGEKIEWVIQKGTELGLTGFVPLRTQRAVMQLEEKKAEEKVARWQKIAGEAVKQSRRVVAPRVERVSGWKDLPHVLPPQTQWLIPYEDEKTCSLRQSLPALDPEFPVAILIGPEGGFTPEEVALARETLKALSVSLGPRILRTETAALTALVMTLAHFGDLG